MRAAVTSIETSHTAFEPRDAPAGVLHLILRRVKLRARRRAAWLAHLHGNADGGVHPVTSGLDDRDSPNAEAAWARGDTPCRRWTAELESVEEWLAGAAGAPLRSVAEIFGSDIENWKIISSQGADAPLSFHQVDGQRGLTTAAAGSVDVIGQLDFGPHTEHTLRIRFLSSEPASGSDRAKAAIFSPRATAGR